MKSRKERKKEQRRKREELLSRTTPPLTIDDVRNMAPTGVFTPKRPSRGYRVNKHRHAATVNWEAGSAKRKTRKRVAKLREYLERTGQTAEEHCRKLETRRAAKAAK